VRGRMSGGEGVRMRVRMSGCEDEGEDEWV